MKIKKLVLAAFTVLFVLGVCSCQTSNVRIGWAGSNIPGNIAYSYTRFTGEETDYFVAASGQKLILEYTAEVHEGSLDMQIEGTEQQVLWGNYLEQSAEDEIEIYLEEPGMYQVIIKGNDTEGSFRITWQLVNEAVKSE